MSDLYQFSLYVTLDEGLSTECLEELADTLRHVAEDVTSRHPMMADEGHQGLWRWSIEL